MYKIGAYSFLFIALGVWIFYFFFYSTMEKRWEITSKEVPSNSIKVFYSKGVATPTKMFFAAEPEALVENWESYYAPNGVERNDFEDWGREDFYHEWKAKNPWIVRVYVEEIDDRYPEEWKSIEAMGLLTHEYFLINEQLQVQGFYPRIHAFRDKERQVSYEDWLGKEHVFSLTKYLVAPEYVQIKHPNQEEIGMAWVLFVEIPKQENTVVIYFDEKKDSFWYGTYDKDGAIIQRGTDAELAVILDQISSVMQERFVRSIEEV